MPLAIPAIIGGIAAFAGVSALSLTGFMAIGVGVAIGAGVGAVVGGIQAAITGGDIMEGVLFGAVGGAVGGAIGGFFGAGGFAGMGSTEGMAGIAGEGAKGLSTDAAVTAAVGADVAPAGAGGWLVDTMGEAGAGAVVTGGIDMVKGLFTPVAEGAPVNEFGRTQVEQDLWDNAQMQRDSNEKIAGMRSSGGGGGGGGAENYTREVAEINRLAAKEVADKKSGDLRAEIDSRKEERESGYLREDETRQRMRDSSRGVLVRRQRMKPDNTKPEPPPGQQPAPQTPNYVEGEA